MVGTESQPRKRLVQVYTDVLMSQGTLEAADQILRGGCSVLWAGDRAGPVRGRETFKKFICALRRAFADLQL